MVRSLRLEPLESRQMLSAAPYGPLPAGEYQPWLAAQAEAPVPANAVSAANPFERIGPLGGLMALSRDNTGTITSTAESEDFTFPAQAGQTVTAVVTPVAASATLTVELVGVAGGGPVTQSSPGGPVVLPPRMIPASGSYTVRITGNTAADLTDFSALLGLNLAVEVDDSGEDEELSIDNTFLDVPDGRYAVLGHSDPRNGFGVRLNDPLDTLANFTVDGPGPNNLWHLSTGRSADGLPNHSPTGSLYFGQAEGSTGGGNYNLGDAPANVPGGTVTSDPISLAAGERITLMLNHLLDIQDLAGFDTAEVLIEDLASPGFVPLLSTSDASLPMTTTGWETVTADLTAFAGRTVRLRFGFQAFDQFLNDGEGWFVDDVFIGTVEQDEYTLSMAAGDRVDVVLAGLPARFTLQRLELVGTDGLTTVATGAADPAGVSAANYDLAIHDAVIPAAGTYTLRVTSGLLADYAVLVTRNLTTDSEPNNDPADPLREPLRRLDNDLDDHVSGALGYLGDERTGSGRLFAVQTGLLPDTDDVVELDPVSGAELNRFALPENVAGGTEGLAYDGTSLFYASGEGGLRTVYELNPDTGAVVDSDSFASLGLGDLTVTGLGMYRGQLIVAGQRDSTLEKSVYFIDTTADNVVRSWTPGISPQFDLTGGGLAGASGRGTVFVTGVRADAAPVIAELDAADGSLINSFAAPTVGQVLGLALVHGTLYVADNAGAVVHQLDPDTGAALGSFAAPAGFTALGGDDALDPATAPADRDIYTIQLAAGVALNVSTATPMDGTAGSPTPANTLDPRLVIRNPGGAQVAADNDSAGDGKNAAVSFAATSVGLYRIEVSAQTGAGEYVLDVSKTTMTLLSDLNADGFVNSTDLGILLNNWGIFAASAAQGNIVNTATSAVDSSDLGVLLNQWTGTPAPAPAVGPADSSEPLGAARGRRVRPSAVDATMEEGIDVVPRSRRLVRGGGNPGNRR